ncbi:hypothetical protein M501DRAFT_1005197 [Patellaria atrata CBS 101060]|uniref:SGF29 C-terminal domain-containing protein n=1 Tax=Patellaria atrata CBS 101060 TaxID=1346257 RepID=A0A9P4S912_9PEZI|nr:hypothetical protein M501DRAFT_1005197 [Patellaria atrata CBS 101060]
MAARNRGPRSGQVKDDANEERNLWNQLRQDAKKVDTLVAKSDEIMMKVEQLDREQEEHKARYGSDNPDIDDQLEKLHRDNVRLCSQIEELTTGESDTQLSITSSLELLAALRESSEADVASRTASSGSKPSRNPKRKSEATSVQDDRESIVADSPGVPSPKVAVSKDVSRLMGKTSSRAGSVPATREASVKAEERDGDGKTSLPRLPIGTEVFYRNKKSSPEGEGMLYIVTSILDPPSNPSSTAPPKPRRYEIKDADAESTNPGPIKAYPRDIIQIPQSNANLPDIAGVAGHGKRVLALYPDTTTFYKAELIGGNPSEGYVKLRFEGEENDVVDKEVERRYVLPDVGK